MKKALFLILGLGIFLSFSVSHLAAQEKKTSKVSITITKDDVVTVDTTFELKEGQDPEMIKKIVSHLAGEDIHMKISKDKSHSDFAWVHADDDVAWHAKKDEGFEYHFGDIGIDLDSLKEAMGGKKMMVIKDDNGNFTIKELGDDMEMEEFHFEHSHKGDMHEKHGNVMIFSGDEDCDHVVKMKDHHMVIVTEEGEEDGETRVIVKTIGDDEKGMEKYINVYVTTDEDCEGVEEEVDVYVVKKGDKNVKVVKKKVKVEIEEEDEENDGEESEKKVKKK